MPQLRLFASRQFLNVVSAFVIACLATQPCSAEDIPSPLSPTDALASFVLTAGFEIELVASEPLVMDPVAIAWGADGKLWVVEMGDYPLGIGAKGEPGGRVKYLEDDDGDGQYDRSTLFLDRLSYPTGVMPWRKGVIVSTAPDIFYAEDTNGDGRADVREVLLSGFAEGNQQHRVNGLRWGLDNWIHCANGDSGGVITNPKSGERLTLGRRDFRFDPRSGKIEPATGQTQFGLDCDDWGHWFGSSNSRPLMHYVLPDEYLRRNPHLTVGNLVREVPEASGAAAVYPVSRTLARFNDLSRANRFTSACGCAIYRDILLGEEFTGNSFVCEPVHNLVHREIVERTGVTFASRRAAAEQRSEFLASTDHWFRPAMARTGPDGALWVVDMYRLVIEHPEWIPKEAQARFDIRAGHDRGRIYRVYRDDAPPRPIARFERANTSQLVEHLESPNGCVRDLARQIIVERHDEAMIPALRRLAWSTSFPETCVQALAALESLGGLNREVIQAAWRDLHPQVRRWGVRVAAGVIPAEDSAEYRDYWRDALSRLARDADADVRLQVAFTLGELDHPSAVEQLARLAVLDSKDPYLLGAALSSMRVDRFSAGFGAILRGVESDPLKHGDLLARLAGLAAAAKDEALLGRIVPFAVPTAAEGISREQLLLAANLLDTVQRHSMSLDKLRTSVEPSLRDAMHGLDRLRDEARKLALDPSGALEDRLAAVAVLGLGSSTRVDADAIHALLRPQSPPELQRAALAAMSKNRQLLDADRLLAVWPAISPAARGDAADALLGTAAGVDALLSALEQGRIPAEEFDAARRARLVDHKDSATRVRAAKIFSATNSARREVVEQFQDVLRHSGDAMRGAIVFGKRCAQCHRLGEVGHPLGPDLAALSDKNPAAMLTAILDPNRAVEAKFINYAATTTQGLSFTGMLEDESAGSVTLLAAEMKRQVLPRGELDEFASTRKSLMPEGMEKDLSRQDLADVIALIGATRAKPKPFVGNEPRIVRPEALRGEFYLLAEQAEIFGPSLVFEPKYANLGYWRSAADHAAWSVAIERETLYEVSVEYACPADSAGNVVELDVAGQRLTSEVASTGNWDTYQSLVAGRVKLAPGEVRVLVRPDRPPRGALFDLKSVRLRPVK